MKVRMMLTLLSAAAAVSCGDDTEPAKKTSMTDSLAVEAITRLTTVEWAQATSAGDVRWYERHLADELMMTTGRTGKLTTKADEIAALRPSAPAGGSEKVDDLKVQIYGNVGVTTFRIDTTGTDDSGAYHRRARYTEVWVHRDDRWQLVASHSSLLPR